MNKSTWNLIVCLTLAVSILICVFGCGKRTTSSERYNIKNDSLQINNSIELTQNTTFNDIGSVKPFDPLKPMLWNGNWHYNVVLEFDKSIKSDIEIKGKDNLSYEGSESITSNKNTEKKDNANLYIGLSIVIGTLFVLYITLKKYIP